MKKLLATTGLLFTLLLAAAPLASAQVEINPDLHPVYAPIVVIPKGNAATYGNYYLQLIAGGLLYLAGPVAILIIATAGLRYVTSHGDQNALEGAKKTLEWAIIGLIVIIFAYAIVRVVITVTLSTDSTSTGQSVTTPGTPSTSGGGDLAPGSPQSGGGGGIPGAPPSGPPSAEPSQNA